jgi:hypothetical protein
MRHVAPISQQTTCRMGLGTAEISERVIGALDNGVDIAAGLSMPDEKEAHQILLGEGVSSFSQ